MSDTLSKTSEDSPRSDSRAKKPRVIAFLNQKGGVGKTTTTVNIGAALAGMGRKVLMLDLDPQAHMTLSLGYDPADLEVTVCELLLDETVSPFDVVRVADDNPDLGVVPAETNLAGLETELADAIHEGQAQTLLRDRLAPLCAQFDDVLIDCPPSLGLLSVSALVMAQHVIVPMQPHYLAMQGMGKLLESLHLVSEGLNPALRLAGVVMCMNDVQSIHAREVSSSVEEFFAQSKGTGSVADGAVLFYPPVRRNIKLAEAPSFGQSIHSYAPESNGAEDYRALALAIHEQLQG